MTKGTCYYVLTFHIHLKRCTTTSVMSGIITGPYFHKYFKEPTALEVGTMVAVLEIGAFSMSLSAFLSGSVCNPNTFIVIVTSLAAGRVGDIIGRKGTLFNGAVVFTIGGAIQTFTTGFWSMIVGRVVSGFGVGLLSYVPLLCGVDCC